jgi:hypothetical protein
MSQNVTFPLGMLSNSNLDLRGFLLKAQTKGYLAEHERTYGGLSMLPIVTMGAT